MATKITYTQQGDYLLPNLKLPEQDSRPIGLWGQQHLRYIKRSRPVLYTNLLTKCKLNEYLADIDEQARKMYDELVQAFAKEEGCTEQLKASNPMLWVSKMNNIRNRAQEIVNTDIFYQIERIKTVELNYLRIEIASRMVFSIASCPYLSTCILSFAP